jgi:glycosyltransferase involved in cell wall biosynthesis
MSLAIVHDHLVQRGGAERFVLSLAQGFKGVPIQTSLYSPRLTYPEFANVDVRTMPINRLAFFRARHRLVLPLLAPSFSSLSIDADVTLCSSSGWSHGVRARGMKIVYCHSPARWLYSADEHLESASRAIKLGAGVLRVPLHRWDQRAMATADLIIANSNAVRLRVWDAYGRDAEVLFPPCMVDINGARSPVAGIAPGFFFCVSRLLAYKNVGAIVRAFSSLPDKMLVVVGRGPEYQNLVTEAGKNVLFLESVDDPTLRWLYSQCSCLLSASYEDFGLTPIEAAAYGKPAIVLRRGGFLDTVVENVSGLFFDHPQADNIAEAVGRFESIAWDPQSLVAHAQSFSEAEFHSRLRRLISSVSPEALADV